MKGGVNAPPKIYGMKIKPKTVRIKPTTIYIATDAIMITGKTLITAQLIP